MPTTRCLTPSLAQSAAMVACLALATGCGLRRAETAYNEGRYTDALDEYRAALRKDSKNVKAKIGYQRTAPLAAEEHLKRARAAQKAGREDLIRSEVGKAAVLDPGNAVALDWLARIEEEAERKRKITETEDSVDAARQKAESKAILPINPRSLEGMDLNFTRKTSLKEILQQLSRNSGVNIILHSSASAQDTSISVDLRGLSFQRVLDTLMLQTDMFYRVMDPNTLMVFKKTTQNQLEYENKLIKTFYLSNAEVDQVRSTFTSLMPNLRVFVDKRLNALTVMAKQSELTIAQRIVNQLDKAKAEVMVYVELLEVTQSATEAVGLMPTIDYASKDPSSMYRMGATLASTGISGGVNSNQGAIRISKSQVQFLFPGLILDMLKTSGEGKLLASPNVRVISGESGEINIGDKITSTQSSINTGSTTSTTSTALSGLGGIGTSQTQYAYEDIGVKIKVKPRVHYNGDITLELETDVKSQIASSVAGRPDLSQRVLKTMARLRDGETAVFGGLLKEDEQKSRQGVWGLADIPVIGSLLSSNKANKSKKDVILTIRAVVVRKPDLQEEDFEAFDPDQAPSSTKPFGPKPEKAAVLDGVAPRPGQPGRPQDPLPGSRPAPGGPQGTPLPGQAPQGAPAQPPQGPQGQPRPAGTEGQTAPAEPPTGAPAPDGAAPKEVSSVSDLVFFMSPMSASAPKGKTAQITLYASGAEGLTSGTLELQLDPKLKLGPVTAGDFLTGDGGSLEQGAGKNGMVNLTFKRRTGAGDSGVLAVLNLECVETGKAAILIQGGTYKVGNNPISARVVNAMISVE